MEHERLHKFDAYLRGEMDAAGAAEFQEQLRTDEALRTEFEEYLAIVTGVRQMAAQELKERMGAWRNEQDRKAGGRVRWLRVGMAVAAVVALLLVPSFFIYRNLTSHQRLFQDYYISDPGLPVVMGNSTPVGFAAAMTDYKDGKYSEALRGFAAWAGEYGSSDTLLYYSGLCMLLTGDDAGAVSSLGGIGSRESAFYIPSRYYIGLALIRMKDERNAKSYLKEVADSGCEPYAPMAGRLAEIL